MKQHLASLALFSLFPISAHALVLSGTGRAFDIEASASASIDPILPGTTVNLALSVPPLNEVQGTVAPFSVSDTVVTAGTGLLSDGILTQSLDAVAGAGVDHFQTVSDVNGSPGPHFATAQGSIASASYTLGLAGIADILTVNAQGDGVGGLIATTASTISPDGSIINPSGSSNLLASGVTISVLGFTPAQLGLTLVSGSTSSVILTNVIVAGVGTVSGTVSVGLNLFEVTGLSLTTATASSTALTVGLDLVITTALANIDVDSDLIINQSSASLVTDAVPEPRTLSFAMLAGLFLLAHRKRINR